MCEIILFNILDQFFGNLSVIDKIFILFLHPGTKVYFVNIDRLVKSLVAFFQPLFIAPLIPFQVLNDACGIRTQFAVKSIRIYLVNNTSRCLRNTIFICIARLNAFDIKAPRTSFIYFTHFMAFVFPAVK